MEATKDDLKDLPILPDNLDDIIAQRVEEALKQRDLAMGTMPLPANAFRNGDGMLMHRVKRMTEGGSYTEEVRPLAMTLEEARDKRWDFYHPTLGLIWDGYKLARDRTPQSIMSDGSQGGLVPPGQETPAFFGNAPEQG